MLLLLAGPILFVLLLPIAFFDLGATSSLLTAAIMIGFRASTTNSSCNQIDRGIGLLWFAVRKEWRHLAVALAATAAVFAVSWLIDPHGAAGSIC